MLFVFALLPFETILSGADVLSVQLVLSDRSRGLVGAEDLQLMKKDAILVNTSRGPLVDEKALLDCLNRGGIRGAALDVFDEEPLPESSPWRTTKWGEKGRSEVLLTPHTGYVEEAMLNSFYEEQAENIERWLKGEELLDKITSAKTTDTEIKEPTVSKQETNEPKPSNTECYWWCCCGSLNYNDSPQRCDKCGHFWCHMCTPFPAR